MPKWILDNLDTIVSFLTFLVALGVALREINQFRRDRKLSQLSDLKNLLVRIRSTFQYINYKVSSNNKTYDNFANESGFSIAKEFSQYLENIKSSEELTNLLNDQTKMTFLYYALIKVCDQSVKTKKEILTELNDLKGVLFRYQTNMPVLVTIVNDCLTITRNMISGYTTLLLFKNRPIYQENNFTWIDSLKDLEEYNLQKITENLTLVYCNAFYEIMNNEIMNIVESNQKIIEIITDLILEMNDDKLLNLQKWDKNKFSSLSKSQVQILNLTNRILDYEAIQSLVINWMIYKDQCKKNKRFNFTLGCIQIRRILNQICEEYNDADAIAKFIDKYPEDLSVSVGSSETDNIRNRNR